METAAEEVVILQSSEKHFDHSTGKSQVILLVSVVKKKCQQLYLTRDSLFMHSLTLKYFSINRKR